MASVAQKYFVDDDDWGSTIRFLEIAKKHITIQIDDIIETRKNIKYSSVFHKCIFDKFFISISECQNGQNIDDAIARYHNRNGWASESDYDTEPDIDFNYYDYITRYY